MNKLDTSNFYNYKYETKALEVHILGGIKTNKLETAQLRFQTRQFGIFVNGTAKGQGTTLGSGVQSLKAYGFYTKPILSPW